jgi:uncharacterized protein YpmS
MKEMKKETITFWKQFYLFLIGLAILRIIAVGIYFLTPEK